MRANPIILLADDDPDFITLFRIALESTARPHSLVTVNDGPEAINWLRTRGDAAGLVLLDVRLPRMGGMEVLSWLRNQAEFDGIPVVLMTGLARERDREKALRAGAAEYLVKPLEFSNLLNTADHLCVRWLAGRWAQASQAA